jgi:hypothetical protein
MSTDMARRLTYLEAELQAAQEREKALRERAADLYAKHVQKGGHWRTAFMTLYDALAASPSEKPGSEPTCPYCGCLGWTVEKYGRVTHKEACPHRTDPWSQSYPQREKPGSEGEA